MFTQYLFRTFHIERIRNMCLTVLSALLFTGFSTAQAATYTVNSTGDVDTQANCASYSGECTLRGAINAANANPGQDRVKFNILSGSDPNKVIYVGSADDQARLPIATDSIKIDGTSQPGYAKGNPTITIDGSMLNDDPTGKYGLRVFSSDSVIQGLRLQNFKGSLKSSGSEVMVISVGPINQLFNRSAVAASNIKVLDNVIEVTNLPLSCADAGGCLELRKFMHDEGINVTLVTDYQVKGNLVKHAGNTALSLIAVQNGDISNNVIAESRRGMNMFSLAWHPRNANNTYNNNSFESLPYAGEAGLCPLFVNPSSTNAEASACVGVRIINNPLYTTLLGNRFNRTLATAIFHSSGTGSNIIQNTINEAPIAIELGSGGSVAEAVEVVGNTFSDIGEYCVRLNNARNSFIINNDVPNDFMLPEDCFLEIMPPSSGNTFNNNN